MVTDDKHLPAIAQSMKLQDSHHSTWCMIMYQDILWTSCLTLSSTVTVELITMTMLHHLRDFREAIWLAQANLTEAEEKQMRDYNHQVKGIALEIGDEVLIINYKDRTKGKLADLWDWTDYVIIWKDPNVHVFWVENPTTNEQSVMLKLAFASQFSFQWTRETNSQKSSFVRRWWYGWEATRKRNSEWHRSGLLGL